MSNWIFNGDTLNAEEIDDKAVGFIYLMTNKNDGKKYIGKKLLTKAGYKTVKGKRKKIRKTSEWKEYYSSCKEILEIIECEGKDTFKREVLCFAYSKIELTYLEEKFQFCLGVLENDNYYNANIRCKIFKQHINNKVTDIDSILNRLR